MISLRESLKDQTTSRGIRVLIFLLMFPLGVLGNTSMVIWTRICSQLPFTHVLLFKHYYCRSERSQHPDEDKQCHRRSLVTSLLNFPAVWPQLPNSSISNLQWQFHYFSHQCSSWYFSYTHLISRPDKTK